jgi:hypothetical protein
MTVPEELVRTIQLCRDFLAEGVSDEEITRSLQSLRILCVSNRENLSCHAGQTALITLVSLASRMGMQVSLEIPDTPLVYEHLPLSGRSLPNVLLDASEEFVPGATICGWDDLCPDAVFALGDSPIEEYRAPCWRLTGDAWGGYLDFDGLGAPEAWNEEFPMGALISATLATTEAFKLATRRLSLQNRLVHEFLKCSPSSGWSSGSNNMSEASVDLGEVDFVSAGAITQATLYVLSRVPRTRMRGRVFDDDVTAASNLNRNALSLRKHVGCRKVDLVTEPCPQFLLEPVFSRFGSKGFGKLAPRVIVGVDDIPSRWAVQRCEPEWLAVGGTSHFNVSSSVHRLGEPCSGCLHSVDEPGLNPIPTISFVSFWAGILTATRLIREAVGESCSGERQHIWLSPLRMDSPRGAIWSPVPALAECPVGCTASRSVRGIDPIAA